MDRADLEAVVAVADHGSITAAADELHVAQPALSRRLARLERDLGDDLFVRGRHGAAATATGRVLAERARAVLAAFERAEQDTADAAAGRAGTLRLGTIPTLGADRLPAVLARMRAAHPTIRLELETSGDSALLHRRVAGGELDVAVAMLDPTARTGTRVAAAARQALVVVVPSDHRLAGHERIRREELADEHLVTIAHREGLRLVVDALYSELGVDPTVPLEITERDMLIPLVTAGLGVTIVPESFARQRAGEGVVVRPLDPPLDRPVGAIVRDGPTSALCERFLEVLGAELSEWGPVEVSP